MSTFDPPERCPECGAVWQAGLTCQDHFSQMLAWEFENPEAWALHHLTVLCYNLQHPSNYSPSALDSARDLLIQFVVQGITPRQIRQQNRQLLDSHNRTRKITGTPAAHGIYAHPVSWTMTAADVTSGGLDGYLERVQAWADSVYIELKSSGNLTDK